MIDKSILDQVDPQLRVAVESAVMTLGNSGVLDAQLAIAFESISAGSVSEDPAELAARILDYRRENHGIIALKAFAEELKKEQRNA